MAKTFVTDGKIIVYAHPAEANGVKGFKVRQKQVGWFGNTAFTENKANAVIFTEEQLDERFPISRYMLRKVSE